jgi:hypothetical protein
VHILHKAYQVLKQRQCPPPVGGYSFPKNDHVTTKMGRLPPSPCKCCGSSNQWDKECPNQDACLERAKWSANLVALWPESDSKKTYATAYAVLLNERLAGDIINQPLLEDSLVQQGFKSASSLPRVTEEETSKTSQGISKKASHTTIEDIEDEDWLAYQAKPKSAKFLMEEVLPMKDAFVSQSKDEQEGVEPHFRSPPIQDETQIPPKLSETPGPPIPDIRIKLKKKPFALAGASAVGVLVVAVQGWVRSTRNKPIDIRLDSCADVILISQEYLESLQDCPPCQNRLKMNLWQLTDKDATLQGYV